MNELAQKRCVPCMSGVLPLADEKIDAFLADLDGWSVRRGHHLTREFAFPDFTKALAFVNEIGAIAEEQQHHPDIHLSWGRVRVEVWTHKLDGLTESDFILAARIDKARRGT